MSKINQILNVLIGRKLRASTVIRYTGLKPSLVYPYLSKLYEQGRITRENEEPPYLYTAAATPEVFLLNLYKKFNELSEIITNLEEKFWKFTYNGDYYGNNKKEGYGLSREDFKPLLQTIRNCIMPDQRAIEELLKKRFNFQS